MTGLVDPTKAARDAFVEDILKDPQKYKRQWTAEARVKYPHLTDEQHEADWKYVSDLMGLE